MHAAGADHTPMIEKNITLTKRGSLRFSALVVFTSLEQLAVPRWYKRNVLADVKVLGVQGETVSQSSPEARLALSALLVVSAWARVRSLSLILIWRPNVFKFSLPSLYPMRHSQDKIPSRRLLCVFKGQTYMYTRAGRGAGNEATMRSYIAHVEFRVLSPDVYATR